VSDSLGFRFRDWVRIPNFRRHVATLGLASLVLAGITIFIIFVLGGRAPVESARMPADTRQDDVVVVSANQMHQIEIAEVFATPFLQKKSAIGQIAFNEDTSTAVFSPFYGRVTRILAKIGDVVRRGDPLFEIDSPEVVQAQTDLIAALHNRDKAKSQLLIAQRHAERQVRLAKSQATSGREVDQALNDQTAAESDMKTAEGALNAARNRLRIIIGRDQAEIDRVENERLVNPLITINSPIDGTVVSRKIGPGQYVRTDATEALYTIVDLKTMWLKANVPEVDIPLIRVGQQIEIKVNAIPNRVFNAKIVAIGASSDASTRRVAVRSEILNPDGVLKAEMFANFQIIVGKSEPILSVPVQGVIREGEAAYVWVELEPGRFQRRRIELGVEQGDRWSVLSGVREKQRIVSRGAIFVDNEWRQ
jgi:membrane fusion protein, heavy metal efflux system